MPTYDIAMAITKRLAMDLLLEHYIGAGEYTVLKRNFISNVG